MPAWSQQLVKAQAERGRTPVVLAVDGAVRAVLAFGDRVRPEAKSQLQRLAHLGYRFEIASGDHQRVVEGVAEELGICLESARGEMSPETKLARVNALRARGERVFMVGDGVNDAAAMAAATVGFAVHGGAETCLHAADVFATRAELAPIVEAVVGSRRTLRAIRRGIVISLAYDVVGILLAVLGILSPLRGHLDAAQVHLHLRRVARAPSAELRTSPIMSILFVILPITLLLSLRAVLAYAWATKSGQFDDSTTPAVRALHDPISVKNPAEVRS